MLHPLPNILIPEFLQTTATINVLKVWSLLMLWFIFPERTGEYTSIKGGSRGKP